MINKIYDIMKYKEKFDTNLLLDFSDDYLKEIRTILEKLHNLLRVKKELGYIYFHPKLNFIFKNITNVSVIIKTTYCSEKWFNEKEPAIDFIVSQLNKILLHRNLKRRNREYDNRFI